MHASTLIFGLSAVAAAQALSFSDVTSYVGKSIKLPRQISGWSNEYSQDSKRDGNTGGWVTPERFGQSGRDFDPNNWPTGPHSSNCPAVWTDVAKELQGLMTENGQCNDFARAAIRAAFHDCFAGGCDGSLYLAQEYTRFENVGLQDAVPKIGALAEKYQVGVADMIQFAGGMPHVLTFPIRGGFFFLPWRSQKKTEMQMLILFFLSFWNRHLPYGSSHPDLRWSQGFKRAIRRGPTPIRPWRR